MNLSELPPLEPPEDRFAQVMNAVHSARRRQDRVRRGSWLAAAATVLLSLGVIVGLGLRERQHDSQLAGWIAYSQELEAQLHALQSRSQAMSGHRAAAVTTLASEVAQVDWALAQQPDPEDQVRLWQARAELLNQMVSVQAGGHWVNEPRQDAPIVTLDRAVPPVRVQEI